MKCGASRASDEQPAYGAPPPPPMMQQAPMQQAPMPSFGGPPKKKINPAYIVLPICAFVLVALAIVLVIVFSGNRTPNYNNPGGSVASTSTPTASPTPDTPLTTPDSTKPDNTPRVDTPPPVVLLTVNEARDIAQRWLNDNSTRESYTLDRNYHDEYTHRGENYYLFIDVEIQKYWFNVLVHMETGALFVMILDDGMDASPPQIEPIAEWFDRVYNRTYSVLDELYEVIWTASEVLLVIYWDDGRVTRFTRDEQFEWYMYGRDGENRYVYPSFYFPNDAVEMWFPTASVPYYLYADYRGIFGSETLTWECTYWN